MTDFRGMLAILAAVIMLGAGGADRAWHRPEPRPPPQGGTGTRVPTACSRAMRSATRSRSPEQTIVYFSGSGQWDNAFETIVDGFKTVNAYLQKQGIKPSGPPMTIYTSTNDTSFQFWAAVPIAEQPKDPPTGDIAVGNVDARQGLQVHPSRLV